MDTLLPSLRLILADLKESVDDPELLPETITKVDRVVAQLTQERALSIDVAETILDHLDAESAPRERAQRKRLLVDLLTRAGYIVSTTCPVCTCPVCGGMGGQHLRRNCEGA